MGTKSLTSSIRSTIRTKSCM